MITVRTSPAHVNRVRQDWTANGGVYGDGGVYATVTSNDPFAQLGPTLDLTFAGVPTDQFTAATTDGYSINLNLSSEIYQIAAQYAVWGTGGLQAVNFADIVTFTRASTATYFNSAGTLTTAATNEARFDYDPATLLARGFLIEEARTNSIRNNTMQGAVAGTPGTLPTNWSGAAPAVNVIGTGTESGITYVDLQIVGTTAATTGNLAFETITAAAAASGQTWTNSAYIRLIAGSFTNVTQIRVNMQGYTSASASNADSFNSADIISSLSATNISTNRRTLTATLADATTAYIRPRLFINWTSGAAVDFTLRIGLPQLELGAFATSVIPTTTTALTRSADVASVNTLSPWYNATEGTIFVEASPQTSNALSFNLIDFNNTTANNRISLSKIITSGNASLFVNDAASVQCNISSATWTDTGKLAGAYKVNDFATSYNGATPATDTTGTVPSVTRMQIGVRADGGNQFTGYLRRITYYPRRLANADLQTITT